MTNQTEGEQSICDVILERMAQEPADLRNLVCQMFKIVEGHDIITVAQMGSITLHYAVEHLSDYAGPEAASELLQRQIRMLETQSRQLGK